MHRMEMVDYFTNLLSIEVFIQGFVFTLALSIGLFMILSDQRDYFANTKNFKDYRDKLGILVRNYFRRLTMTGLLAISTKRDEQESIRFTVLVNSLSIALLFFIATLVSGVMINSISDKWMEQKPSYHLGMKSLWHDKKVFEIEKALDIKTNDAVRIKVFETIMNDVAQEIIPTPEQEKLIKELYYLAKHSMLKDETWREYIVSTQKIIDITESFSFSFFILFCLCYINFFINIFRDFFDSKKNSSIAIFLPALIFILLFTLTQIVQMVSPPWPIALTFLAVPCIIQVLVSFFESRVKREISNFYSLTSVILIYISSVAYMMSSIAWMQNNEEVCSKVFGVYRYEDKMLRDITKERTNRLFPDQTKELKQ